MQDFFRYSCRQKREYFTGPQKMHFSKRYPTRLEKCIFVGKSALFLVHFSPLDNAPELQFFWKIPNKHFALSPMLEGLKRAY